MENKLSNIVSNTSSLFKENWRYGISFGTAFVGSYFVGMETATYLENLGYSETKNALFTLGARTASYFAINLPLHKILHRKDYQNEERNSNKEMKIIGSSNIIGAIINNSLRFSLHWTTMKLGMHNPYAFLISYFFPGAISTGVKFVIDFKKGVMKNKNSSSKNNLEDIVD